MHFLGGLGAAVEERLPRTQGRTLSDRLMTLAQDGFVEPLILHGHGHLVDARQVLALHDAVEIDVAEVGHLLANALVEVLLRAKDEHVGLDTDALELLHAVLRGLRLQLTRCVQVGHVGQVDVDGAVAQLPFHLADRLHERRTLDVADRTANLGDDEVVVIFLAKLLDVALDLVRDVRYDLDGLAQIVAAALLVDDALVDAARRHGVGLGGLDAGEPLIVSQVKVRFHTIDRHIALAMLIGVQRSRVDIDVGIELLNGDVIAPCLEQLADR